MTATISQYNCKNECNGKICLVKDLREPWPSDVTFQYVLFIY